MSGHVPPSSPIVTQLIRDDSDHETEEVMALIGFVGPGHDGDVRLYPDVDLQRWMDIPQEAIRASSPLEGDDVGIEGRNMVWVNREVMFEPVFKEDSLLNLEDEFAGSRMSTWQLIPATRYVAAQILDLVPRLSDDEGD